MRFATDCYFHIGYSHLNGGKPCQDYALADLCGDAAYAIVSDGCSSGGHTDVGARLLTFSVAQAIHEHREILMHSKVMLSGLRETLGLSWHDTLATCIYAYVTPDRSFALAYGDGIIAHKVTGGKIYLSQLEWMDNRPFYPAYSGEHLLNFIQDHGGDVDAKRLLLKNWQYIPGDGFHHTSDEEFTLGEGIEGIRLNLQELAEIDCIAIFSDGAAQIDGLDWKDAVVQLLSFKTVEGEFAKRRMMRAIKDAQKNGRGPMDDIAYAVIRVIHEEEEAGNDDCSTG